MIAWAGAERMALGLTDTMDAPPRARWLLDANADGAGRLHQHARGFLTMASFQFSRGDRRRCMGDRARRRRRARRPRRDALCAQRRSRRADEVDAHQSAIARRAHRQRIEHHWRHIATAARADIILIATPAQHLREAVSALAPHLKTATPVIASAKGIERGTHQFMTEVIAEAAPDGNAGDPVGAEFCRRRGARASDRRYAGGEG